MLYRILVIIVLISVNSCAITHENSCNPDLHKSVQELIFFGSNMPNGIVTEKEWSNFIDTIVTPRFPEGFTHTSSSGQWKGDDGIIIKELSYALIVVHSGSQSENGSIKEIIDIYKQKYKQEAVLRINNEVCVSF